MFSLVRRTAMNYVGIDLHKHRLTICVVDQDRNISGPQGPCTDTARIDAFFASLGPFEAVVEATAAMSGSDARSSPWPSSRAGPSRQAAGHRRDHPQIRQARRSGPRRVPGPGHDPPGLPAHAPATRAPHAGPPPAIPAPAPAPSRSAASSTTTTPTAATCSPPPTFLTRCR